MSALDWVVLVAYLVAVVAFGLWTGRGNRRIEDFFLAGRQMRWWAIGLSVMATQVSAITFIGTTGQAYADGMRFLVFYFGLPFAMVILCVTLVPFFYRARVYTAYEYLERRFDARTRTLTSLLFLLSARAVRGGHALRAVAHPLRDPGLERAGHHRCSWAGSTILYVVYGGNKSVIWTDVVQMADHLDRDLPLLRRSRWRSSPRASASATPWPWPRRRAGCGSWTPRRASPRPTPSGAASSAACS